MITKDEPWIFISYRRTAKSIEVLKTIKTSLCWHFGQNAVFLDIDSIQVSSMWNERIEFALHNCEAMIVIIDNYWDTKKLFRDGDWVRHEIYCAFIKNIPIIPVLIDDTLMPSAKDLPEEIANLSFLQALTIDTQKNKDAELVKMCSIIQESVTCKIEIVRRFIPYERRLKWENYIWELFVDNEKKLELSNQVNLEKSVEISVGIHNLKITWYEFEGIFYLKGDEPPVNGYFSKGEDEKLVLLSPGKYTVTLQPIEKTDNRFFLFRWFSNKDLRKREITLLYYKRNFL